VCDRYEVAVVGEYRPTACVYVCVCVYVCRDALFSRGRETHQVKDRLEIGSSCWQFLAPIEPMKPIEPEDEVCSDKASTGSQYSMPEYSAGSSKRLTFKKRAKGEAPIGLAWENLFISFRPPLRLCCGDHAPRRHLSPPPWPTRMRFV
jgi:hypothetical protein